MIEIFDTHTHINTTRFETDYEEVIRRAYEEYGVKYMNLVGYDEQTNYRAVELATKFDNVYATVGWHPVDALDFKKSLHLPQIEGYLKEDKVVAVGETGLDYHWTKSSKEVQFEVFDYQIDLAIKVNKPLVIHMRESTEDVVNHLELRRKSEDFTGIMHSYSGSVETVKRLTNISFMVSLSGIVTFKNARNMIDVARGIQRDQLLVETDAPFLTPEPFRGRRNEPGYTRYVVDKIAAIRCEEVEEVAKYTTENALKIFKIAK